MSKPVIEGIKLIRHNAARYSVPDDFTYPFRLDAKFRPPGFMDIAFIFIVGGSEEIVVRGMTAEKLEEFVAANGLRTHPRLISLEITQPVAPPAPAPVPPRASYETAGARQYGKHAHSGMIVQGGHPHLLAHQTESKVQTSR